MARLVRFSWGKSDITVDWEDISTFAWFMDDRGASIVTYFDLKSWMCNHINFAWTMKADGKPLCDFSEVLHWSRTNISTGPRDYVYALLGHSSATVGADLIIEPKYNISLKEVYTNLVANTVKRTNSIHILAFVDHGKKLGTSGLPSWVPDWKGPDLFAPLRYPTQAAPKVVQSLRLEPETNILHCQGFLIDDIAATWDMITPKELPAATTYEMEVKKKCLPFLFGHFYSRVVVRPGIPLKS